MDIRFVQIIRAVAPSALIVMGLSLVLPSFFGHAEAASRFPGIQFIPRPKAQTGSNTIHSNAQIGSNSVRSNVQSGFNVVRPDAQTGSNSVRSDSQTWLPMPKGMRDLRPGVPRSGSNGVAQTGSNGVAQTGSNGVAQTGSNGVAQTGSNGVRFYAQAGSK